jgi:hypothetical protein
VHPDNAGATGRDAFKQALPPSRYDDAVASIMKSFGKRTANPARAASDQYSVVGHSHCWNLSEVLRSKKGHGVVIETHTGIPIEDQVSLVLAKDRPWVMI